MALNFWENWIIYTLIVQIRRIKIQKNTKCKSTKNSKLKYKKCKVLKYKNYKV